MEITVLSGGCAACNALYATIGKLIKELGLNATLNKEQDIEKIMSYNVMTLPGIVIDGKVVAKGRISEDEVRKILIENS